MKIKLWVHVRDCGDGSAYPFYYRTEDEARKAADEELMEYGQAFCDNVFCDIIDTDDFDQA